MSTLIKLRSAGPLKGLALLLLIALVIVLIFDVIPGDKGRPGGEATHHGQAVLHEPGPVVQCEEQRSSQQTGGETGQLRPAVGSAHPESGFEQLPGMHLTSPVCDGLMSCYRDDSPSYI